VHILEQPCQCRIKLACLAERCADQLVHLIGSDNGPFIECRRWPVWDVVQWLCLGLSPAQKIFEFFHLKMIYSVAFLCVMHITAGCQAWKLNEFAWYSTSGCLPINKREIAIFLGISQLAIDSRKAGHFVVREVYETVTGNTVAALPPRFMCFARKTVFVVQNFRNLGILGVGVKIFW